MIDIEILQGIIDKTIQLEFMNIIDTIKNKELLKDKDYIKCYYEASKIFKDMLERVDKDTSKLLLRLITEKDNEIICYSRYYFKKGVIDGITKLKYLGENMDKIIFPWENL